MMELLHSLRVDCIPPTRTQQQDIRVAVSRDKLGVARAKIYNQRVSQSNWLQFLAQHRPDDVFDGAVCFVADLEWPWRRADSKRTRMDYLRLPRETGVDCDNVAKGLLDAAFNAQWIANDARVAGLILTKWWGHNPGVSLAMYRMLPVAMPSDGGIADLLGHKRVPPPPIPLDQLSFNQATRLFLTGVRPDGTRDPYHG